MAVFSKSSRLRSRAPTAQLMYLVFPVDGSNVLGGGRQSTFLFANGLKNGRYTVAVELMSIERHHLQLHGHGTESHRRRDAYLNRIYSRIPLNGFYRFNS